MNSQRTKPYTLQVAQKPTAKAKTCQRVCLLPTLASLRKEKPDT